MKDLLLAVDVGSQSLRAALFDSGGRLTNLSRVSLAAPAAPRPGWAEQDPEHYWRALCTATRSLISDRVSARGRIAALALTGQRSTVINMGADGRPLRPAILWPDQRVLESRLSPLPWWWRLAFLAAGQGATVDYLRRQCELTWIAHHQPEVWAATHKVLLLSGYLHFRLTGAYRDAAAQQVGYLPFDHRRQRWAHRWNWKWPAVRVDPAMLPELVPTGEVLGELSETAARDCGLPAGLPVVASAGDKACEALGAGCLDPAAACLSFGTQASVLINTRKYFEPIRLLPAFPAAVPGWHAPEVTVVRGFWMVSWFRDQFAAAEAAAARRQGRRPEAIIDEWLETVEPGALGLMLQPYWGGGLRFPGVEAKGAVIGFGAAHGRAHLYRAIIEGLCYALRDGLERIERKSARIGLLRVAGGAAASDAVVQIAADVMRRPAERLQVSEASALGAAINAAVATGLHSGYPEAVAAMCRTERRFEPDPDRARLYDRLYRRVYRKLYPRLRGLYREIRAVTGYP